MYKSICIWGASTTEGFYDITAGGWADRIKRYLKFKNAISVYNLGISGDHTQGILDRLDPEANHRDPDIIIFSIVCNDFCYLIKDDRHIVNIAEFKQNTKLLIKKAKKYTKNIICLGAIPVDEYVCNPCQGDKLYLNRHLKEYSVVLLQICKKENVKFIELFDKFENQNYKKLLYDGLHPNSKGHKLIFDEVKNLLWKQLR